MKVFMLYPHRSVSGGACHRAAVSVASDLKMGRAGALCLLEIAFECEACAIAPRVVMDACKKNGRDEPGQKCSTIRGARLRLDERPVAQFCDGLTQLRLCVHDDRSVPGHRLLDRLAGDEQETHAALACLDDDLVAAVERDQRSVPGRQAKEKF